MSRDEIIKLAFELGTSVAESDEIVLLKELQNKLNADVEASNLVIKYKDAKMKIDNKVQQGLQATKSEEDHIQILEQQLSGNALLQELMSAQEKFDNLMQGVYFAMNQAITGSCGGSCDSCGEACQ